MKSLCPHLLGAELDTSPFRERLILDDYDGMTVGVVACATCGATYALELLDWDQRLRRRIFRLATIPREIVAEYETKGGRASCKLEIGRLELEALLAQREATSALVALAMDDRHLVGRVAVGDQRIPTGPWREVVPEPDEGRWFRLLGLRKER